MRWRVVEEDENEKEEETKKKMKLGQISTNLAEKATQKAKNCPVWRGRVKEV